MKPKKRVPEYQIEDYQCSLLLRIAEEFFKNPEHQKGFEEWRKKQAKSNKENVK